MTECESIMEFGYKKYQVIGEKTINIIPLMFDIAEMTIIEMQKSFPEKLHQSIDQIEKLRADFRKGDTFPPIIIEFDKHNKFVTIVDGMHRLMAYRDEGVLITKAIIVSRLDR